ncbi:MAG: Hsp20/alpha crystallin family protein [Candidatus Latescibacterota bacterium]|jgi:HSP20 family protein
MLTFPSLLNVARTGSVARLADVDRFLKGLDSANYPQVGLWANADEAIVRAELPGFAAGDIEVEVEDSALRLSGERAIDQGREYLRRERFSGPFDRRVRLPFAVDANQVKASFSDGILEIKLPRVEADKPRKIPIENK